MLRLKKKLSFNLLFIFIFNSILLSQGIFLKKDSEPVVSISANYLKHLDFRDYDYGISFAMTFKGNIQLNLNYDKTNIYEIYSYDNSTWEEYYSTSIAYFIKPNFPIRCGIKSIIESSIRSDDIISSFSLLINGRFLGSKGTGMIFYPYIEFVQKNINSDEIKLGCYITFNDWWVAPFYKRFKDTSSTYEGIIIGLWDHLSN